MTEKVKQTAVERRKYFREYMRNRYNVSFEKARVTSNIFFEISQE
jgi:hypothetical protein